MQFAILAKGYFICVEHHGIRVTGAKHWNRTIACTKQSACNAVARDTVV
jgi:hypothetical protein